MRWNVVELAENGRYVKLYRGFLLVMDGEQELGRIIIDEMNCLILSAEQATLSKPVMVRLAEHGVPIVICGNNYHPVSLNLPYTNHHHSTRVLHSQINASRPLQKRLWQALVKRKIQHQRSTLLKCQPSAQTQARQLTRLVEKTRSGDPDNCEAQASRLYWQALMGDTFRRRSENDDFSNAALNYGYTVIRAACARATVAAGLNPALGLHHHNQGNPFCLVDDLMEVYRPCVDDIVYHLTPNHHLEPEHKRTLAQLLQANIQAHGQSTTINTSMQILATSLASSYENKSETLHLPQWGNK